MILLFTLFIPSFTTHSMTHAEVQMDHEAAEARPERSFDAQEQQFLRDSATLMMQGTRKHTRSTLEQRTVLPVLRSHMAAKDTWEFIAHAKAIACIDYVLRNPQASLPEVCESCFASMVQELNDRGLISALINLCAEMQPPTLSPEQYANLSRMKSLVVSWLCAR